MTRLASLLVAAVLILPAMAQAPTDVGEPPQKKKVVKKKIVLQPPPPPQSQP